MQAEKQPKLDQELVARAREGDADAFGKLVRRHRARAMGVARTLTQDSHMAEANIRFVDRYAAHNAEIARPFSRNAVYFHMERIEMDIFRVYIEDDKIGGDANV